MFITIFGKTLPDMEEIVLILLLFLLPEVRLHVLRITHKEKCMLIKWSSYKSCMKTIKIEKYNFFKSFETILNSNEIVLGNVLFFKRLYFST